MTLIPYRRGSGSMFNWFDEMERNFFNDSVSGISQFRTDISEKDGKYLMEADLPGFAPEDIHVELDGDTLTISAQHTENNDKQDDDGNYIRRERRYGSFSRSFDVSGIDTDSIKADYHNGVLKLTLPKREEVQPKARRIEIGKTDNAQQDIPLQADTAAPEAKNDQPEAPVQDGSSNTPIQ